MEHEGHSYILLVPLEGEGEPGEEEDEEVVILRIDADEDGEETYVGVEDEDLLDAIFARYLEIAEQEEEAEELLEDEEEE